MLRLLEALLDASQYIELRRLPELICGFPRRDGEGPTLYPVACAPQAWAAGAVFMLLQACLGIEIDAPRKVRLVQPRLPVKLDGLHIRNLRIGAATADLLVQRHGRHVDVHVEHGEGELEIMVIKRDL